MYFDGNSFEYIAFTGPEMGKAKLILDGKDLAEVDLYDKRVHPQKVVFKKTGLKYGAHILTIQVSGNKNKESRGIAVSLDACDVGF